MQETLESIKKEAEHVAGLWNGDESGTQEDKAHCAIEIIDAVANLEALLTELRD
jgi:hypothetical protein